MAAVIRLARDRAWVPALPAAISWLFLFGYQWAFYFTYRGHLHTVFAYYSGVFGDGILIPVVNVSAFVLLRQLAPDIPWNRLPIYLLLGFATATAAFLMQARLDLVNWSMPMAFHWSDIGQFYFFVMAGEVAYLLPGPGDRDQLVASAAGLRGFPSFCGRVGRPCAIRRVTRRGLRALERFGFGGDGTIGPRASSETSRACRAGPEATNSAQMDTPSS